MQLQKIAVVVVLGGRDRENKQKIQYRYFTLCNGYTILLNVYSNSTTIIMNRASFFWGHFFPVSFNQS